MLRVLREYTTKGGLFGLVDAAEPDPHIRPTYKDAAEPDPHIRPTYKDAAEPDPATPAPAADPTVTQPATGGTAAAYLTGSAAPTVI